MSATIHLLNGPNLGLLGEREPDLYGRTTLADIEAECRILAAQHDVTLVARQTDAEHQMIAWLHEARSADGVVINPAAFCYHSVPVLDALCMVECPIVEVHISNIYRREDWRAKSILASSATGVITGLGVQGYRLALEFLIRTLPKAGGRKR